MGIITVVGRVRDARPSSNAVCKVDLFGLHLQTFIRNLEN